MLPITNDDNDNDDDNDPIIDVFNNMLFGEESNVRFVSKSNT